MSLKPQHQIFVQAIAQGINQRTAYLLAYPSASAATAESHSSRLLARQDIRQALLALQQHTEAAAITALQDRRAQLARIVRSSAATLPDDSDLLHTTVAADGSVTKRLPDKLRAIFQDSLLAGHFQPPTSSHK